MTIATTEATTDTKETRDSRAARVREQIILQHQGLVRSIAARFAGRGEPLEDLIQVGNIGLINALDRFNPRRGVRFSTFATHTIRGEIQRHFRDKTAPVKVPRWLQELNASARRASEHLTQELDRVPSVAEVAQRVGVSEEEVLQALEAGAVCSRLMSLDSGLSTNGDGAAAAFPLAELIGQRDTALEQYENYAGLGKALARLNERERTIVALTFFGQWSQARIARHLGMSPMHVSRLYKRVLERLRAFPLGFD
jgi:RNA polymerase sigma-B factor